VTKLEKIKARVYSNFLQSNSQLERTIAITFISEIK